MNPEHILKDHYPAITPPMMSLFKLLAHELIDYNSHTNLTAITDISEIYVKHFADSLVLAHHIPEGTQSLLDIGSGAGFPGLPIAIVRKDVHVTMVDSVNKKVRFIDHAISKLGLTNAHTLHIRAEELSKQPMRYSVITARAVALLPTLVSYALPLLAPGGVFIAMKKQNPEEQRMAHDELLKHKAMIVDTITYTLPGLSPRELIVIKKVV